MAEMEPNQYSAETLAFRIQRRLVFRGLGLSSLAWRDPMARLTSRTWWTRPLKEFADSKDTAFPSRPVMPGREGFSGSACWIFEGAMNLKDSMNLDQRSLMTRLTNSSLFGIANWLLLQRDQIDSLVAVNCGGSWWHSTRDPRRLDCLLMTLLLRDAETTRKWSNLANLAPIPLLLSSLYPPCLY